MLKVLQRAHCSSVRPGGMFGVRNITNYYKFFPRTVPEGPPPNGPFDIDLQKLRAEYLRAQQQSHPDVAGSDNQVSSAELGTAYRVLRNPVSRGEHILALQNANPLEEGMPSLENEDLLMDIMMTREHVSEAESSEELESVNKENEQRWNETIRAMADALEQGDTEAAQKKLIELTYWTKIRQAIDEKLEEIAAIKS